MPALTSITVNDREDTPVAHTFNPDQEIAKGVHSFRESDANGVPVGDNILTVSKSRTASGNQKVMVKLTAPVVVTETINGVDQPKVVRSAYAEVKFTFSDESTTQERSNAIGMVANALDASQTFMMNVAEDLQGIY